MNRSLKDPLANQSKFGIGLDQHDNMNANVAFSSPTIVTPSCGTSHNVKSCARRSATSVNWMCCSQNEGSEAGSAVSRRAFFTLAASTAVGATLTPLMFPGVAQAVAATTTTTGTGGPFVLPGLGYAYDGLEPYISEKIMRAHHDAHFATYVKNLNAAVGELPARQKVSDDAGLRALLAKLDSVQEVGLRTRLRNNGGGYLNHEMFFAQMAPKPQALREDAPLMVAIRKRFGSMDKFRDEFLGSSAKLFGSGFTWLVTRGAEDVEIMQTANQDNPVMSKQVAVLACDCWEHSWYYQYGPTKKEYFAAWWNVIDWSVVNDTFVKAKS